MNVIQGIFQCITSSLDDEITTGTPSHGYQNAVVPEKSDLRLSQSFKQSSHTAATNAVMTLQGAEKTGDSLEAAIANIVTQAGGWTERIATSILAMLENVLKDGSPMGQAMREAYDKACALVAALGEFVQEHPIFCTVVALGILVILAPAVIHALGFSALGPVEGKSNSAILRGYS
jgi:hypothetical protein